MSLYPHQAAALDATDGFDHVAYYLDMGLGKTYVGAEKMQRIGNGENLLVCQKSKITDWMGHFAEHTGLAPFDLTRPKGFEAFLKGRERPAVGVINYELAWRRRELLNLHGFTLMLDESSLIQNKGAKQTKFVLRLDPSAVILLSGTPTAGKYEDLWTQAHLLGWGISEKLYQSTFVNWETKDFGGGFPVRVVNKRDPYKNVERLKAKLRQHGAVFMKTEDVLDMPGQNFVTVEVPKLAQYDVFAKNEIVEIDGETLVGDTTLTKRLRMRQLCGAYGGPKLSAFSDLVQSTGDRLVVFYNFDRELAQLEATCERLERPVSVVNGKVKDLSAYERFDDSVTFVQYQAGAMGLNLQMANKVIYFTLPERSELFEQSKKRIHRIGQERPCFYYVMECAGTIERLIYKTLERRKDFTDELFREACYE